MWEREGIKINKEKERTKEKASKKESKRKREKAWRKEGRDEQKERMRKQYDCNIAYILSRVKTYVMVFDKMSCKSRVCQIQSILLKRGIKY